MVHCTSNINSYIFFNKQFVDNSDPENPHWSHADSTVSDHMKIWLKRFLDCIIIPYLQFIWNVVYKKQLISFSIYLCNKLQLSSSFCIKKNWAKLLSEYGEGYCPWIQQTLTPFIQKCFLQSYIHVGSMVLEKMLKIWTF